MNKSIVHITINDGHRPSYRDLFALMHGYESSTGPILSRRMIRLVHAQHVIFATIDDDYLGFIIVAILRALLLKQTTGIFIRLLQCFRNERPIVYKLKRVVFSLLRLVPYLNIVSIIPHYLYPELADVSNDWIYDPQMWDLWVGRRNVLPITDLSRRVERLRRGRKVLIFVGVGNNAKGLDDLIQLACKEHENLLVVIAGRIEKNTAINFSSDLASLRSKHGIVEDRYVSDQEILSLYRVADFAWCYYTEQYDQASGVFGRAVQTQVMPIVREGSTMHALARRLDIPVICDLGLISCSNRKGLPEVELHALMKQSVDQAIHITRARYAGASS